MRAMLIGMNNPLSTNPAHALFPEPVNCAGWRLWRMLHERAGVAKGAYAAGFERRNLVHGPEFDRRVAREVAEGMVPALAGRRVVVLGAAVRDAFRLPPVIAEPVVSRGVVFRQLPHPSGRCRWYNDPKNRAVASLLLEEEYAMGCVR